MADETPGAAGGKPGESAGRSGSGGEGSAARPGQVHWLRKFGFEAAPLVLALILRRPLEEALRQALALSQGSVLPFVTRPVSLVLLLATAASSCGA